jgi:hypothetical protein
MKNILLKKNSSLNPIFKFITFLVLFVAVLLPGKVFGSCTPQGSTTELVGSNIINVDPASCDAYTGTWIVPCGVTSFTVTVIGGGGGAGSGNGSGGSGGGGGAAATFTYTSTPGSSFSYSVGLGGAGSGNGSGGSGATTTFGSGGTLLSASGGGGGSADNGAAGTGGNSTSGPSGYTFQNGSSGSAGSGSTGGSGGNNGQGLGGADQNNTLNSDGSAGGVGGGGAGGNSDGSPRDAGGNGGTGRIIITWTPISAGPNQTTALCATTATLAATAAPPGSTGTWTVTSSPASPAPTFSPNNTTANASVSGLVPGVIYTFRWTITTSPGPCTPSYDEMTINAQAPTANAGPDQRICQAAFIMDASPIPSGFTGTWSCPACAGAGVTISNVNDPFATLNGFNSGESVTLTWTVTNGSCSVSDNVTIAFPTVCNDDPCGATSLTVGGACITQNTTGATISQGMVEGGCVPMQDDLWFSAVVPSNGVLSVSSVDANGTAGNLLYMAVAIYDGPCGDLVHAGCTPTTSLTTPATSTYTGLPGSTVYIRTWNWQNATEENFTICATSPAFTPDANDIEPGNQTVTSITCGSPMDFYDPGGPSGNYAVNQTAMYVLCPSTAGQFVSIDFATFALENGFDRLTILNGSGAGAALLGQWTGTNQPGNASGIITSSAANGCLTVIFQSDQIITAAGWTAIVSCSPTAGTNTTICSNTNCTGGCGTWVCADGLYPTSNDGNGVQDLNEQNSGCFGGAGEVATKWFYFTALTAGTLEFTFNGPNGQDYDFAVWGPGTTDQPPCPLNTGDGPIRCSFADVQNTGNPVGLTSSTTEQFESGSGDGWVAALNVLPGQTYAMILNIYMNGNPQPTIDLDIAGSGTLSCNFPLPITLTSFEGINQGETNLLNWVVKSQQNNDFFTIERSVNGFSWELVGHIEGAGNTDHEMYYDLRDANPYFPVTYYRLKQTDFDGNSKYSDIISVSNFKSDSEFISSLFPNPSSGYATFVYSGRDFENPINVEVINEMGQVVYSVTYLDIHKGMPATLRTSDLATGMYQVVFTQGNVKQNQKLAILK